MAGEAPASRAPRTGRGAVAVLASHPINEDLSAPSAVLRSNQRGAPGPGPVGDAIRARGSIAPSVTLPPAWLRPRRSRRLRADSKTASGWCTRPIAAAPRLAGTPYQAKNAVHAQRGHHQPTSAPKPCEDRGARRQRRCRQARAVPRPPHQGGRKVEQGRSGERHESGWLSRGTSGGGSRGTTAAVARSSGPIALLADRHGTNDKDALPSSMWNVWRFGVDRVERRP